MSAAQSQKVAAAHTPPPPEVLMHMLMGMWSAQAVATAARMGIADSLGRSQPQKLATLTGAVGADAPALARLLRALVSLGVLVQPEADAYALSPVGEMLRSDVPGSMRDVLIAETDTPHWQAWGKLEESVRTGQPMIPKLFDMPIFGYYEAHPQELGAFSRAMGNFSALAAKGTLQNYDFSKARHVFDVGGAHGDLLLSILKANPQARGTLFDMPHVVQSARASITASGDAGRCETQGGDFFQSVPAGGDLYLLKFILHDWPDAESVRILSNCRAAIAPDGKLLVIEMVVPDDNHPSPAQLVDLNMLVMTGGQERTAREYGALMSQAGFRLSRVIPTGTPFQILEAVAA